MPHLISPTRRLGAACLLAFALAACGGDDEGAAAPPPPAPVGNSAPTASFVAALIATAQNAVVFDAGASASADGSALQYSWDFGDGQRGGGKTIAHVFAGAGTMTVTLTVVDAGARSASAAKTVAVAAAAAAGPSIAVHVRVRDLGGVAVPGVAIAAAGPASAAASTDASGRADIVLGTTTPLTLRLSKAGYADQFAAVVLPAGAGTDTLVEATLRPRDAALTLADAHAGGSLGGRDGAVLILPPDALVTGAGTTVAGAVQISLTPVDVTLPNAGGFPGRFDGVVADGTTTPIVSFGAVEFVLMSGSDRLQLAPGKTATIELPVYASQRIDGSALAIGDSVPLWSLDEATSIWIQEGTGTIVASAASPTGLAMRANVSHFTWWNIDIGFEPYGPKPRCVYDTDSGVPGGNDTFATATVCNMLAEIDRGLSGNSAASRAQAQARPQADPLPPRIAGYSRSVVLPIAGGTTIPVPANVGIALQGTALNGTWAGRTVVNGPVGLQQEVLVKMRPLAGTGPVAEAIALPFDGIRSLQTGALGRFTFTGGEAQFARITAAPANGSTLTGQVRVLQGTTALSTAAFGPSTATLVVALPAAGTYEVEIGGVTNTPGAYRLQVELLGGVQTDSLPFAFDATRTLPLFTTYRAGFDVAAPSGVHLAFQRQNAIAALLRLRAPDGSAVVSETIAAGGGIQVIAAFLPVAGRYVLEVAAAQGGTLGFRVTAEPTAWTAIAPPIDTDSSFALIDLVADRNGKPVIGYARNVVANARNEQRLYLRRWTGSAWEDVGAEIAVPVPCSGNGVIMASFGFDSTNAPILAYAENSSAVADGSRTVALRFSAGAWQGLGSSGGVMPKVGGYASACTTPPRLAIDASDRPTVAYKSDNEVWVQRLDAGAWTTLKASASSDYFPMIYGSFELRSDAAGAPWLVIAADNVGVVRRWNNAGSAWTAVGPNGGTLPQTGTSGFIAPKLAFDAAGNPVLGSIVAIGIGVSSPGVIVYRFDGSIWNTTGGWKVNPTSYTSNLHASAFTLSGNDALMAWSNADNAAGVSFIAQRNTPAGWSGIGPGLGEVVQYNAHGITPDQSALDPRLLTIASDVYLALTVRPPGSTVAKVTLLKKTGG